MGIPRTTIVGGRPPGDADLTGKIPMGIERLIRFVAEDPGLKVEFLEDPVGFARARQVELTQMECSLLVLADRAQLEMFIDVVTARLSGRRTFLKTAAGVLGVLGAAWTGVVSTGKASTSVSQSLMRSGVMSRTGLAGPVSTVMPAGITPASPPTLRWIPLMRRHKDKIGGSVANDLALPTDTPAPSPTSYGIMTETPTPSPTPTATEWPTPMGTVTPTHIPTVTPTPTQWPTPTGTPTFAPSPTPVLTPTPAGIMTPTPTPSPPPPTSTAPPPTPTQPSPTATPEPETGTYIEMPSHFYRPTDSFYLKINIYNAGSRLTDVPLFVVLQVGSMFYCGPQWTTGPDLSYYTIELPNGWTVFEVISPFVWPDGAGAQDNLYFWSGLTEKDLMNAIGHVDSFKFGFGD